MTNHLSIDDRLLIWINSHHTPILDSVMWIASQASTWLPLYILLIVLLYITYRPAKSSWVGYLPILISVLVVAASAGLADYISSGILKPLVARPRPSHSELEPILHFVRGYQGGQYGFPSSHAADTTAVALSFCLLYGKHKWWQVVDCIMAGYVLINCYSRMYLGVHYPSDILVGALIGGVVAYVLTRLTKHINENNIYLK